MKKKNPYSIDKRRNLFLAWMLRTIFRRIEKTPQGIKRNRWPTIYRLVNPQWGQNKKEKCCHVMDWQLKWILYGCTNLDYSLSENELNIWQSHQFHHKSHGKLENGIYCKTRNPSKDENPKRHIFAIIICYSNDVIQLLTEELHRGLQTYETTRKV